MKVITIIPLQKGPAIEDLTYFTARDVSSGDIVSVPLRSKKILGLVVSVEEVSESKGDIKNMSFDLRKVLDIKGQSAFRHEYLEATLLASTYFVTKKNDAITSLLPAVLRESYDKISSLQNETSVLQNEETQQKKIRAEKLLLQLPLEDRVSIYKTLIRESFALKKSIFVVLPNERDVKIFTTLLERGIENFTFPIHGGLSTKKIIEQYEKIITLAHPVLIIGTAQFLSISRYDIGTVLLENESANGYKMIARPYIDLRTFVELFANLIGARLIFADSMLRHETIGRKNIDNVTEMHPLSFRIHFDGDIEISGKSTTVIDTKPKESGFKVLMDEHIQEIKKSVSKGENVFIFALRKGLATITVCRDCNEPLMCKSCGAPVVLYTSRDGTQRMFICNRCKTEMNADTICPKCGSWNLTGLGIGTDTIFEELKKVFAQEDETKKITLFQLDKETALNKSGAEKIIHEFEKSTGAVLVGTEMALFYIKEKIPLSIIASFDSLWSIPNFKMSEKIIQLIFSIISKTKRKLIIQTKNDKDPVIQAVKAENLLAFVREEIEDKKNLGYPPFKRFIKITFTGDKDETTRAKQLLKEMFADYAPDIFSGFIARLKGKYVTHALLKIDIQKWSLPELSLGSSVDQTLASKLMSLQPNFSINVDPEDLL